jgi:hypothetical protein
MRKRVDLKSPVRENRPPGSVRGARGNPCPYLDIRIRIRIRIKIKIRVRFGKLCASGGESPPSPADRLLEFRVKTKNGKV